MIKRRTFLLLATLASAAMASRAEGDAIELRARDATIKGNAIYAEKDFVGRWNSTNVVVSWTANIVRPGNYRVVAVVSCATGYVGAAFEVLVGNQRANGTVPETGGLLKFQAVDLGPVILRKVETLEVNVRALNVNRNTRFNLRAIRLEPEDQASQDSSH